MQNKTMLLAGLFVAMVFLSGCTQLTTNSGDAMEKEDGAMEKGDDAMEGGAMNGHSDDGDAMEKTDESGDAMEETGSDESSEETESNGSMEETETESQLVEFTVIGDDLKFFPETFEVNKGDTVRVTFTSADVFHTFSIDELDVDIKAQAGETVTEEFVASESGEFELYCRPHRGVGMIGTFTVN